MTPSLLAFLNAVVFAISSVLGSIFKTLVFVSNVDKTVRYISLFKLGFMMGTFHTYIAQFYKLSSRSRKNFNRNRMLRTLFGAQIAPLNSQIGLVSDDGWDTILDFLFLVLGLMLV